MQEILYSFEKQTQETNNNSIIQNKRLVWKVDEKKLQVKVIYTHSIDHFANLHAFQYVYISIVQTLKNICLLIV